jgi:mannonate dehydratase
MMRLALTLNVWNDEDLIFAQQFGVNDLMAQAVLPQAATPENVWDEHTLRAMRNRVEQAGLHLAGLDGLPWPLTPAEQGGTARRAEIDRVCRFVEAAGAAGIPLIAYRWTDGAESERAAIGRGKAMMRTSSRAPITSSNPHIWDDMGKFIAGVVPVAEQAGIKLACQPNSPLEPGPLHSAEDMQHLLELSPSPCHGVDLNHAAVAHGDGYEVLATIERFVRQGKTFTAQVQNIAVTSQGVSESFLDEDSAQPSLMRVLQAYQAAGYTGTVRPAMTPGLVVDTPWGHKGQAFQIGYLKSLLQVTQRQTVA